MTPPSDATPNPDLTSCTSCTSPGPIVIGFAARDHLDRVAFDQSSRERSIVFRESRADGLHPRPEARTEDLEVRLGAPAAEHLGRAGDLDLLHVQLLGHRVPQRVERSGRGRKMHHRGGERLAGSGLGLRPDPTPELDDQPRQRHRLVETGVDRFLMDLRVVGEVHGVGPSAAFGRQVRPDLLRDERRERSEERRHGDQALVQRVERGGALHSAAAAGVPEPPTRTPHVPVREVVHERLDPPAGSRRVVAIHPVADLANGAGQTGQDPPIEEGPGGERRGGLGIGIESIGVRIEHEEGVHVPERQQELAHRLFQHRVAESP